MDSPRGDSGARPGTCRSCRRQEVPGRHSSLCSETRRWSRMEPPGMSLPGVPRGNAHGLRTHGNESDGVINYNAKYTLVNTFPPANQLQVETQKARWWPELAGRWPRGCRRGGLADRCHLPPKRPLWPVKLRGPCCPRHTPRVRGAGPARHGARSPGSLSCPCEGGRRRAGHRHASLGVAAGGMDG